MFPIVFATIDLLAPSCYVSSAWDYVGAAVYAAAGLLSGWAYIAFGPGNPL